MKFYIWGLGAVGYSFLQKLKENGLFNPELFFCVEPIKKRKDLFVSLGGFESHFINERITKDNYLRLLKTLKKGDYLLDFATDIKNLDILEYCLQNGIHYLSTADSSWNPDPSWISDHQHYLEYLKLKNKYSSSKATSIVLFGMNPGLVSCFAKLCLREIIEKDNGRYVKKNRNKLRELIDRGSFSLAAKKLGITDIQEVDYDDHIVNIPYESGTLYSTWNCQAYYYETISAPEIALGNKRDYFKYNKVYDCDFKDLYIGLFKSGFEYKESTCSPQGKVDGHLSTHEEIFMLRRLFTYKRYKPAVHFVYAPCPYAIRSVEENSLNYPKKMHLIQKNEIVSGGESVGIILQGKKFKTRYYGNYLKNEETDEVATITQVSAGAYAAFKYMLNHRDLGLLFPEELDELEIMKYASKYLKSFASFECEKIPMNLGRGVD
ncbi:MAG: saccharopine dehydrogenase NADP-binding domain-containing protein [Bacilli bacterium]